VECFDFSLRGKKSNSVALQRFTGLAGFGEGPERKILSGKVSSQFLREVRNKTGKEKPVRRKSQQQRIRGEIEREDV